MYTHAMVYIFTGGCVQKMCICNCSLSGLAVLLTSCLAEYITNELIKLKIHKKESIKERSPYKRYMAVYTKITAGIVYIIENVFLCQRKILCFVCRYMKRENGF